MGHNRQITVCATKNATFANILPSHPTAQSVMNTLFTRLIKKLSLRRIDKDVKHLLVHVNLCTVNELKTVYVTKDVKNVSTAPNHIHFQSDMKDWFTLMFGGQANVV